VTERLDRQLFAPVHDDLRGGFVGKIGKMYQTIALVSFKRCYLISFREQVLAGIDDPQFYDFTGVFDALAEDVPLIMDGFTHYSDIATRHLSVQMADVLVAHSAGGSR